MESVNGGAGAVDGRGRPATGAGPVFAARQAAGETQEEFAKRLGVGVRSLRRYEIDGTLPRNAAVMRSLLRIARRHGISVEGAEHA